jgi:catechol 2,3-dioxygenase-like lactoylglutathione lyase family enzyme
MHHAAIRTANIHRAIAFYEHLGFVVQERFSTGYTLACWMIGLGGQQGLEGRIELIEIPEPRPAPDAFGDEHYTGYYHLSFDLTALTPSLNDWLADLEDAMNRRLTDAPEILQPLTVLLRPMQQVIGDQVYEVAFIADADGLPLELIRLLGRTTGHGD